MSSAIRRASAPPPSNSRTTCRLEEKERRHKELSEVCLAGQRAFAAAGLGQTVTVLAEGRGMKTGWLSGYTGNYVRVQFEAPPTLRGELVPVTLTDITPDGDALASSPGRGRRAALHA